MKLRKSNISTENGLKRNMDLGLIYTQIEIRWDAMCQFVNNAAGYGVNPGVGRDLAVINTIREQQHPLPTEYLVSTHKGIDDKRVKLTFNKKDVLFELDTQTEFITYKSHKNLQAKFFFDNAQSLTKVSYQKTTESRYPFSDRNITNRYKKVIDLQQKQIDQESENEMTK